jgi:hypothetical protein
MRRPHMAKTKKHETHAQQDRVLVPRPISYFNVRGEVVAVDAAGQVWLCPEYGGEWTRANLLGFPLYESETPD